MNAIAEPRIVAASVQRLVVAFVNCGLRIGDCGLMIDFVACFGGRYAACFALPSTDHGQRTIHY
jgi:hypothetical protein